MYSAHTWWVNRGLPPVYTCVVADVASAIKELESRNWIFEGAPNADSFIEPEGEGDIEAMLVCTDGQLVADVFKGEGNRGGRDPRERR